MFYYLAFGEADIEYHNELYNYIVGEGEKNNYIVDKPLMRYVKINRQGNMVESNVVLSEYIRHQIHHGDNTNNAVYTFDQLQQSIGDMRDFIIDYMSNNI